MGKQLMKVLVSFEQAQPFIQLDSEVLDRMERPKTDEDDEQFGSKC